MPEEEDISDYDPEDKLRVFEDLRSDFMDDFDLETAGNEELEEIE